MAAQPENPTNPAAPAGDDATGPALIVVRYRHTDRAHVELWGDDWHVVAYRDKDTAQRSLGVLLARPGAYDVEVSEVRVR